MNRHLTAYALVLLAVTMHGQERASGADTLRSQIDRIFRDHAYDAPRFGPARWLPGGAAYAIVERVSGGGSEIARYDAAAGTRSVSARTSLDIDDYAWSPDGTKLLVFTNTRKVWRQKTRGDYYVLDAASDPPSQSPGGTRALKKLGGSAPEASLM